ncbi:DinB family protein [Paenibacillus harenae]|uniref:DinB family protein n=1 Tax=Paenibacillus harenae TaxID=306543 RepID=UPI00041E8092|nr:DinB family protein [Paenibacillus harenae]
MKLSRQEILLHGLEFAFQKEGWNPPLMKALEGINEGQADWRPETGASNTIREIVTHLIFYKEQLLQRLQGIESPDPSSNEVTFTASTEQSWEQTVAKLIKVHHDIQGCLKDLMDEDLDRPLSHFPIGGQMLTLAMHDVYHTGQIILLRKLQGSWPTNRNFA